MINGCNIWYDILDLEHYLVFIVWYPQRTMSSLNELIFFVKACYLRLYIGTLSNISNVLSKCSFKISTTIRFQRYNTFVLASWYVTSLCPNTIGFWRFPNQMGEMTCLLCKSLSIIFRTFPRKKIKKKQSTWNILHSLFLMRTRVEFVQDLNFLMGIQAKVQLWRLFEMVL